MKISEVMTANAEVVSPDDTIREAAKMMDDLNVGALPVCDGERLVGMITDRDITVRATSVGKAPDACKVKEVMTAEVEYCWADDTVDEVAQRMSARQIRRLPVIGADRRLVGIVSLGDLATGADDHETVADTVERISEPAAPDRSMTYAGGKKTRPTI
jgi:CBS domain-containing protein